MDDSNVVPQDEHEEERRLTIESSLQETSCSVSPSLVQPHHQLLLHRQHKQEANHPLSTSSLVSNYYPGIYFSQEFDSHSLDLGIQSNDMFLRVITLNCWSVSYLVLLFLLIARLM